LTKPIDKQQLLMTINGHLKEAKKMTGGRDATAATATTTTTTEPVSHAEPRAAAPVAAPAAPPVPATAAANSGDSIASDYANDPDMREVIEEFVARLPVQVAGIKRMLDEKNLDELRRAVHQMKGAGGGYGFGQITTLAAKAEQKVKEGAPLEAIAGQVDELVQLVRRVRGYDAKSEVVQKA
jgi:HPt (histidine-containing phosphotransfer) domain-containing protein